MKRLRLGGYDDGQGTLLAASVHAKGFLLVVNHGSTTGDRQATINEI